jgi:hypothetical protein
MSSHLVKFSFVIPSLPQKDAELEFLTPEKKQF